MSHLQISYYERYFKSTFLVMLTKFSSNSLSYNMSVNPISYILNVACLYHFIAFLSYVSIFCTVASDALIQIQQYKIK